MAAEKSTLNHFWNASFLFYQKHHLTTQWTESKTRPRTTQKRWVKATGGLIAPTAPYLTPDPHLNHVLCQTHTTNSLVIAHYTNRPTYNFRHQSCCSSVEENKVWQPKSRKTCADCRGTDSHQIRPFARWLNPVSPPFDAGGQERTLEMVSPFLPSCQPRSSPNLRSPVPPWHPPPPIELLFAGAAGMMTITGSCYNSGCNVNNFQTQFFYGEKLIIAFGRYIYIISRKYCLDTVWRQNLLAAPKQELWKWGEGG